MSITFRDFPLSEAIQRAVAEVGYTEPTPIQAQIRRDTGEGTKGGCSVGVSSPRDSGPRASR